MPHPEAPATKRATLTVRCRLLARYAEAARTDRVTLSLPESSTVADAIAALRGQLALPSWLPERPLVAVNFAHALPSQALIDGDELAILPPLAGG